MPTTSAFSRAPVEIWHRILDATLYEPVLFDYSSPWHVVAALRDLYAGAGPTIRALEKQRYILSLICHTWHDYVHNNQRCIAFTTTPRALVCSARPEATEVLCAEPKVTLNTLRTVLATHQGLKSVRWRPPISVTEGVLWRTGGYQSLLTSLSSLPYLVSLQITPPRNLLTLPLDQLSMSLPNLRSLSLHGSYIQLIPRNDRPYMDIPSLVTLDMSISTRNHGDDSAGPTQALFHLPSLRHLYCILIEPLHEYLFFYDLLRSVGNNLETLGVDADQRGEVYELSDLNRYLRQPETSIWPVCPTLRTLVGGFHWLDYGKPQSEDDGGNALTTLYHIGTYTTTILERETIKWLRRESSEGRRRRVEIHLVSVVGPAAEQKANRENLKALYDDGIVLLDGRGHEFDESFRCTRCADLE